MQPLVVNLWHLSSDPHGLVEVGGSNWKNHELLHGQFVSSMASSVNDVKGLQGRKRLEHLEHSDRFNSVVIFTISLAINDDLMVTLTILVAD